MAINMESNKRQVGFANKFSPSRAGSTRCVSVDPCIPKDELWEQKNKIAISGQSFPDVCEVSRCDRYYFHEVDITTKECILKQSFYNTLAILMLTFFVGEVGLTIIQLHIEGIAKQNTDSF